MQIKYLWGWGLWLLVGCVSRPDLPPDWKVEEMVSNTTEIAGTYTVKGEAVGTAADNDLGSLLALFDNANQMGPGFVGQDMGQGVGFGGIGVDLNIRSKLKERFVAIQLKPSGSRLVIEAFDALGNAPLKASAPIEIKDGWVYMGRVTEGGFGLTLVVGNGGGGLLPTLLQESTTLRLRRNTKGFLLVEKVERTDGLVAIIPVFGGEGSYSRFAPARPVKVNPRLATAASLDQLDKQAPPHWRGKPTAFPDSLWLRPWGEENEKPHRKNPDQRMRSHVQKASDTLLPALGYTTVLDEQTQRGGFRVRYADNQLCIDNWKQETLICHPASKKGNTVLVSKATPPFKKTYLAFTALDTGSLLVKQDIRDKRINKVRRGGFLGIGGKMVEEVEELNSQSLALLSGF